MELKESPSERKKVILRDTTTSANLLNAFSRLALLHLLLDQVHSPSSPQLTLPLIPMRKTLGPSTRPLAISTSLVEIFHLPLLEALTLPRYPVKNWFTSALSERTLSTMLSSEKRPSENLPISLLMSHAPTVSSTL